VVAAIDQKILMISVPQMWNLARKGLEFEPRRVLIIMFCGLMDIEKRNNSLHVTRTVQAGYMLGLFEKAYVNL
jgi:hypothetical protein